LSHADRFSPWEVWILTSRLVGDLAGGFTDNFHETGERQLLLAVARQLLLTHVAE
jgi:hypothetical protein